MVPVLGFFLRLFFPTLPPFTPLLHLSEALAGVDLKTLILSPERKVLISSPVFSHVSCTDLPSLHVVREVSACGTSVAGRGEAGTPWDPSWNAAQAQQLVGGTPL